MRQRRQRLQVSTFPFLAVLLCAMGSLILLLLVLDRRARVVARARAVREASQAAAEDTQTAATRRAEWERRRRALHEQLTQEGQEIGSQIRAVLGKAEAAAAALEAEQGRSKELQERLNDEKSRLAHWEEELTAKRTEVTQADTQTAHSKAELAALTADLERMERTLADLKAARKRQQQMYSLVPYRGKRGDNRKPIYIECAANELIFHPDHLALRGPALRGPDVRAEIDLRLARRRETVTTGDGKPESNAYVLMLVRPDGITTYYRALGALQGLPIEFGYEFIDKDWVLDFPEDESTASKQPWMVAEKSEDKTKPHLPLANTQAPRAPPTGLPAPRPQGVAFGGGISNEAQGGSPPLLPREQSVSPAPADSRPGHGNEVGPSGVGNAASSSALALIPQIGPMPGGGAPGSTGPFTPNIQQKSPILARGVTGHGAPTTTRESQPSADGGAGIDGAGQLGVGGADRSVDPAAGQASVQSPNRVPGNTGGAAFLGGGAGPASGASGLEGNSIAPSDGVALGAKKEVPGDSSMATNAMPSQRSDVAPGGNSRGPSLGVPLGASPGGPSQAQTGAIPDSDVPQVPATQSAERIDNNQSQTSSGEPSPGIAGDPVAALTPRGAPKKPVRATPSWPGLLNANRDWIIPIECTADSLLLSSGPRIATAALAQGDSGNNALLVAVQQLIARRQATVRPGEQPYRPMIRFRVRPDGLRSYYLAYPALEALRLPMTRENLELDDTKPASGGLH